MKFILPFGVTAPGSRYVDRDTPGAIVGSKIPANFPNTVMDELVRAIEKSGITPDDVLQLAEAIRSQRMNYSVPGGTANALTVTLDPVPGNWAALAGTPLRLMITTANTSTGVTLNVNGMGAKAVVYNDGSLPQPGDLSGLTEVAYNPVADKVQIVALSKTAALNVKRASLVADRGASSQLTATGVATKVTGYGNIASNLGSGSSFSSGLLTIGAVDAGLWYISGHCRQFFASTSGFSVSLNINASGTPVVTDGSSSSPSGSTAHGSCSRILALNAGDTVEMRLLQTTGADFTFGELYSLSAVRLGNS